MSLRLIVEQPTYELETVLVEKNKDAPSTLYINGPYLMAERKNRNGRIYPLDEMVKEVNRYTSEMISKNRAIGELNHPTTAEINPERACHRVVEMRQEGNYFYGKSKILNTPLGMVVRNMILDDCQLGVSSRSLGRLSETPEGNMVKDLHIVCVDVVADPSVDRAFVNGILESREWILNNTGTFEPAYDRLDKALASLPKKESGEYIRQLALEFIRLLGK